MDVRPNETIPMHLPSHRRCIVGLTEQETQALLWYHFVRWMREQSQSSECTGLVFDYNEDEFRSTNCGPHGIVYHTSDVFYYLNQLTTPKEEKTEDVV